MDYTAVECQILVCKSVKRLCESEVQNQRRTAVVTDDFALSPLKILTPPFCATPSTTWPPVTFVNEVFVNRVLTKTGVEVKAVDLKRSEEHKIGRAHV